MRKIVLSVFTILLLAFQVSAQNQRVSGTVTDQSGEAQIGVTVQLKGTNVAVATNIDGQYSINAPANGVLIFSYLGLKTQELNVGNKTVINVVMESDALDIDAVTIIGYGSGSSLTSAVGSYTSVGGQSLSSKPTPNVADALQGKVAGMQSWVSSGEPSANASIRIRGISSVNQSTAPLYILDGVPVSVSVFNSLNSYDIENITVLKDAASTAIYGSRAANGVIYITSKKGRKGAPPKLTINAQYGVSFHTNNNLNMMNAKELIEFEEMVYPELKEDRDYQNIKKAVYDYGLDFDWEKYVFKTSAPTYNLNAEVMGGGENNRYLFSFGYYKKEGVSINSDMERFNFRINSDVDFSKKFKMSANAALTYMTAQTTTTGWASRSPSNLAFSAAPYRMPYAYEVIDGELFIGERLNYQEATWWDLYYLYGTQPGYTTDITLNGNMSQEFRPIEGLTIKAVQAMDAYNWINRYSVLPSAEYQAGKGLTRRGFDQAYTLTSTNTIDYKHTFGENHNLSVLIGHESIVFNRENWSVNVPGQTDDRLMLLTSGKISEMKQENNDITHGRTEYVFNSFFASLDYSYANKYTFSATVRRDGSSRFSPGKKWGNFYSVGAMWDIKKENFLIDVDAINMLKLRANYGETGNANLANYQWRASMAPSGMYDEVIGMGIATPGNNNLSWETIAQLDLGFTARFFDKLDVTFDWYNRATLDMLLVMPYSAATGFADGDVNVGSLRNRGIELDVNYDIITNKNFYWGVNANVSYNKNAITSLFGDQQEYNLGNTGLILRVGESLGAYRTVERAGIDPFDGNVIWYDKDGNLTKEWDKDNEIVIGRNQYADWTGGFGTTFSWKDLSLSVDFIWCGPKYVWLNEYLYARSLGLGKQASNYDVWMKNIWMEPGQITDVPSKDMDWQWGLDSSIYENASFIRLKNLSLSYKLPNSVISRTNGIFKGVKFYATGRNLLTFTNFPGLDPEIDTNGSQFRYPNSREVIFGVELTF